MGAGGRFLRLRLAGFGFISISTYPAEAALFL